MKKLLILLGMVNLSACDGAPHTIQLQQSTGSTIELICVNNFEYIIQSKGGILLVIDKNGHPKQCNY